MQGNRAADMMRRKNEEYDKIFYDISDVKIQMKIADFIAI